MLVVVGSRADAEARALVSRWAEHGAALLTCEDLSRPGWRLFPARPHAGTAVVGGSVVSLASITGVLVRRPHVYEAELGHVASEDREYVAAEMNACLRCWLAMLRCPVLNRPGSVCLSGPTWSVQQWNRAAARAGARVRSIRVSSDAAADAPASGGGETVAVTVIASRCVGTEREDIASTARRLATAAGVTLLEVHFDANESEPTFAYANPFPNLSHDAVADAVLAALTP